MKIIFTGLFIFLFAIVLNGQELNPEYDSTLTQQFGSDDYGMKKYILVILKTGSVKIEDKAIRDSLMRGHLDNISKLADEGKLIIAGPLSKNDKTYRGIFILTVTTINEAEELLQTDPSIKAGIFDTEIFEWYGAAGLPEYLKIQNKLGKYKM
jgi:uncharacterized protein YciI